jgi:hypothetical protein
LKKSTDFDFLIDTNKIAGKPPIRRFPAISMRYKGSIGSMQNSGLQRRVRCRFVINHAETFGVQD